MYNYIQSQNIVFPVLGERKPKAFSSQYNDLSTPGHWPDLNLSPEV